MVADKKALLDAASDRAGDILMFYRKFAEKKPVMLHGEPTAVTARLYLSQFSLPWLSSFRGPPQSMKLTRCNERWRRRNEHWPAQSPLAGLLQRSMI